MFRFPRPTHCLFYLLIAFSAVLFVYASYRKDCLISMRTGVPVPLEISRPLVVEIDPAGSPGCARVHGPGRIMYHYAL